MQRPGQSLFGTWMFTSMDAAPITKIWFSDLHWFINGLTNIDILIDLQYIVLYFNILYYIIWYDIILYHIILYYIYIIIYILYVFFTWFPPSESGFISLRWRGFVTGPALQHWQAADSVAVCCRTLEIRRCRPGIWCWTSSAQFARHQLTSWLDAQKISCLRNELCKKYADMRIVWKILHINI